MTACPHCYNEFNIEVSSSQFETKYICPILECSVIYYLQDGTPVTEAYPGLIVEEKERILAEHDIEPRI